MWFVCVHIKMAQLLIMMKYWNELKDSASNGEWLCNCELLKQWKSIYLKPGKCVDYVENKKKF